MAWIHANSLLNDGASTRENRLIFQRPELANYIYISRFPIWIQTSLYGEVENQKCCNSSQTCKLPIKCRVAKCDELQCAQDNFSIPKSKRRLFPSLKRNDKNE